MSLENYDDMNPPSCYSCFNLIELYTKIQETLLEILKITKRSSGPIEVIMGESPPKAEPAPAPSPANKPANKRRSRKAGPEPTPNPSDYAISKNVQCV
jgi:hypothetical protein